jgi:hypothetical protein
MSEKYQNLREACAVIHHGSVVTIKPRTPEAREALKAMVQEDALWWGGHLAVSPHHVEDLLRGMEETAL